VLQREWAQRPGGIELVLEGKLVREGIKAGGGWMLHDRYPRQHSGLIGWASASGECALAVLPQNLEVLNSLAARPERVGASRLH
jgi:hypothetical protein